jgi:hypothetical protein
MPSVSTNFVLARPGAILAENDLADGAARGGDFLQRRLGGAGDGLFEIGDGGVLHRNH